MGDQRQEEQGVQGVSTENTSPSQREIGAAFQMILEEVWTHFIAVLGPMTTQAVFRSALGKSSQDYPLLATIEVNANGLQLERFRERLSAYDVATVRASCRDLLERVVEITHRLTGDVVVRKVWASVATFRKRYLEP